MASPKKKYKGRYVRVRKTINGEVKEFYGTSKRDAESKRDEYIRKLTLGIDPELEKESLYAAMDEWLRIVEKNQLKASSYERYEGIMDIYVKAGPLSGVAVGTVRTIALQKWYNELHQSGKSYSQIENLHKLLNKFFRYAFNEGYVNRNPCTGAKNPAEKIKNKKDVFTVEEIEKILNAAQDSRFYCLIKLLASTGMRLGEALALTWKDIDLINQTIAINKSANKDREITTTKTLSSNRTFVFHTSLVADFKTKKKENAKEKLSAGYDQTDLVFPTPVGTVQDQKNFRKEFIKILERADVPYRPPHTFRHSFTSLMRQKGFPLEIIADILGHSSIVTTGDIYSHASLDDIRKAVNSIEI